MCDDACSTWPRLNSVNHTSAQLHIKLHIMYIMYDSYLDAIIQFAEPDSTVEVEEGDVSSFILLLNTPNNGTLEESIQLSLLLVEGGKASMY